MPAPRRSLSQRIIPNQPTDQMSPAANQKTDQETDDDYQLVSEAEIEGAAQLETRCQEIAAATGYAVDDVPRVLARLLEAGLIPTSEW